MSRSPKRTTTQAHIDRMVKRIVQQFDPEQVILFGSKARGDSGPDSDVDLLVVMDVEGSRLEKSVEIRLALREFLVPMDILGDFASHAASTAGTSRTARCPPVPRQGLTERPRG